LNHVKMVASFVRDMRLRALFLQRPLVDRILAEAEAYGAEVSAVREALLGPEGALALSSRRASSPDRQLATVPPISDPELSPHTEAPG
jgi:hypothetical protein